MLNSVITGTEITTTAFLLCTAVSLALGLGAAALNMYKNKYSQSFVLTLAMLPAIVQLIIMLVNGNIGVGVAVAGTIGLVRFRSANGTAKELAPSSWSWPSALPPAWAIWHWRRCSSPSWRCLR